MIFSEPHGHLPRLPREAYRGRAWVFFTDTTAKRSPLLRDQRNAESCIAVWDRACQEHNVLCVAYVVMPDHTHAVFHGLNEHADCLAAEYQWKQKSASLINGNVGQTGMRVWQQQPYDRVLRRNERRRLPLCESIRYIWNNPVRAGITANVLDYPYLGSFLETNARLDSEEWWDDLWEVALSER